GPRPPAAPGGPPPLPRGGRGPRPRPAELAAAQRLLDDLRPTMPGVQADLDAWAVVCQAIFGCSEFRFVE
ncbi:MAG: hypothetical protein NZ700_07845, partial [Gemmataceae bacterium]|nr:hypothetical protein [Gemmataceae bacterium]